MLLRFNTVLPDHPNDDHHIWPPRQGYDLIAPVYDDWYWRPFWIRNEIPIVKQLTSQAFRGMPSLDLGCGTGTYASVLEEFGVVVGLDPSEEMLKMARRRVSRATHLVCACARAIPLRSESVDVTVAARSLCHEQNLSAALRELARITRSGGICVVSEVHTEHRYPRTRIPYGKDYIYIETWKRTPQELVDIAISEASWTVDYQAEFRWHDLLWQPNDPRFFRVDRTGDRAIFFVTRLRRR